MRSPDQVLTAAQMRAAEGALISRGVSVEALMHRAGVSAADWVWRVAMGRPVTVLCGPGNNGGDGYVIAEALRVRGSAVRVVAPEAPRTAAAGSARAAFRGSVERSGVVRGGVLVDCLFGAGLSRSLSSHDEQLLGAMAAGHDVVVAVDLPSGTSCDDGALLGEVPQCGLTLALGAWKPAHFLMPAMAAMGQRRLVDIGIEEVSGAATMFPRPRLAAPAVDAHKYTRGLVGVVAGSMPGAAILAARAAMRAGAGYVRLLSASRQGAAPDSLVMDHRPLAEALADPRWSSLLVGPGLGRDEAAWARLAAVLERRVPTVIDADALHLLDYDLLEGIDTSHVLVTPHEGELASLCETFGVQGTGKRARAQELAELTGLTVLAKGPDNVLAAPDGRVAFFASGPSWLATAGSGDVLAGVAASRLACGADPFQAAGESVWLHSEAARIAGSAFTADDLTSSISTSYHQFL